VVVGAVIAIDQRTEDLVIAPRAGIAAVAIGTDDADLRVVELGAKLAMCDEPGLPSSGQ
jgi:hypothetical protein